MPWGGAYNGPTKKTRARGGGWGGKFNVTPPAAPAKSGGGHGFLHTLGRAVKQTGSDLVNVAEHAPGGAVAVGKATYNQAVHGEGSPFHHKGDKNSPLLDVVKGTGKQIKTDLRHPLRHPGYTLLDVLPGVNAAGKVAEAGRLAKAGESAGRVARAATVGVKPEPRVLKVGGMDVRGHYSRAAGSRVVQRVTDAALQRGAERPTKVGLRAENLLHRRAAKWEARNQRVADATARAPGTRLAVLGQNLKPAELRALRLVAEETPVERRIGAQEMRKARATGAEVARHQERIDLTRAAQKFLTADKQGRPVFKPEATKLRNVYEALKTASGDREGILKNLGLMDQESLQAAKTKVARVAAGASTVNGELVGATDITASPNAVHIGNPVETKRISGNPKVSSTGTFGHTRKPSSLKTSTGGSLEHALERGDVTQIVAERHAEAVRLGKIDRVRKSVAKAGESAPRRPDDVFVWTDKLTKNERIPAEVRKYLDNPDSIAKLDPHAQLSIGEKLKAAVFEQQDWRDPEKVAEFQKLAKQGKGVFVPRRLLGDAAKRDYSLGHFPGMKFVDSVNNAQKAGLVYLKLNYPVVQGVSNVTMNLIQGAFNPVHITEAIKTYHADPELSAVVKDIMGEGAIPQASLEGQGAIARGSQKLAKVMSSKVDTPSRLLAFYYEAKKAGYGGKKMRGLVFDDKNAGDLAEVAQRGKEAIVDFGEQSPFEKSVVKRLIFVYPWQKGATKYASHFLRDHPVQAAALSQAGQIGKQNSDNVFGAVPTYLNGLIPVGGRAVNPAGVNFFQTPAQIGTALGGLVTGNPAEAGAGLGFLAPFPGVVEGLASGHDDIGRPLNSNFAGNVRDLTYGQTPAAQIARAAGSKYDLVRKLAGSRTNSKTFPNPNDAYWRFLLGGLYPRQVDAGALNSNAALQKTGR